MHASRVTLIIMAGLGVICTFLPWATVAFFGSVDGTVGPGWISFVVCAAAIPLALVGDRRIALPTGALIVSALCGVLAGLVGVAEFVYLRQKLEENHLGSVVTIGPGIYLLIIAGLLLAIGPALLSLQNKQAAPWMAAQLPPPMPAYWQQQPQQPQGYWPPQPGPNAWPPNG